MGNSASSSLPALQTVATCDTARFMGTWFVIGVKPTAFEKTCSNAVENYTLMENKNYDIDIDFQYNQDEPIRSKLKSLPQKGWVQGDKSNSGDWKVSPFWPIKMPYKIIELDDKDYSYCVIGYPSRAIVTKNFKARHDGDRHIVQTLDTPPQLPSVCLHGHRL